MFKKLAYTLLIPMILGYFNLPAHASTTIGEKAPTIKATDIHGNPFNLEDHLGKIVVLEWTNHLCPFVVKHYSTGNMQNIQKTATDNGIIWVSIVSSAPGKQGFISPEKAAAIESEKGAHNTTKILDPLGEIGKAYAAKTTPHMFIIDTQGQIAYQGAIDDNPSPSPKVIDGSKNLVLAALDDLTAGRSVAIPKTAPYGCSVKY